MKKSDYIEPGDVDPYHEKDVIRLTWLKLDGTPDVRLEYQGKCVCRVCRLRRDLAGADNRHNE